MNLVYPSDFRHDRPREEITLLLGGKAANIATMTVDLGLPVPPAFTITTEACNAYLATGWPDGLDGELRAAMAGLEARVGRRLGDPVDPLLVSVRSGAPRSMPGMMDTILNLGLNEETEDGLAVASGDPAFARACHERFLAIYRDVVGVEDVPSDPWGQLRGAIEAVFRSWNSDRARTYRRVERISDTLGTGVTVQAMVFGNRGPDSGTGVLFTRNPATGERALYGDVLFDAQGEDVVAGTHATEPVTCLETRMPAVARELARHADTLERHFADCCDIEFTIEQGRLWMLQVRVGKRTPQAALRMAVEMAQDAGFPLTREDAVRRVLALLADPPRAAVAAAGARGEPLARGLGASPGVASGEIRLAPDDAVAAADSGHDVILVRSQTSPDDVHGMQRSRGILTSSGGFASHAAVVARGWGIPAVVGASEIVVEGDVVRVGAARLAAGTTITIDGTTGEVFEGVVAGAEAVVPEVQVLLGWARELGIEVPTAPSGAGDWTPAGSPAADHGPAGSDDALRVLLVKGYCQPDALAVALGVTPEAGTTLMDSLVADGLAETGAGSFRPTQAGREAGAALLAADREALGPETAAAALDTFVALDRRMKAIVTSWQMKGPEAVNDHSDAEYDAAVIARLGELHADVEDWLGPLSTALPRLARYGARLSAAASAAAAGNGKFIASPRVDSYHGAWFELHEDLIGLAGRTRADEVAAGRA